MSIIFGPIPSRRLGRSLGINNIPTKVCSYTCVYCQAGLTTTLTVERKGYYSPKTIYNAVKKRLDEIKEKNERVDFLSFVPEGEPTLDTNLEETIILLKEFGIKIAIFTNSSLMWQKQVRHSLSLADYVSVKVDAVEESTWKKINCPHSSLNLPKIQEGILEFSELYSGKLVTETMLINGLNDNEDDLITTMHFIVKVKPEIAYISVPTRPTAVKGIGSPVREKIKYAFSIVKSIYQDSELLNYNEGVEFSTATCTEESLISILAVHPMRKDAVANYLSRNDADWKVISRLIQEKEIKELTYEGSTYYVRNKSRN
jgi:wyosine [tRNA(Phe)-imidazoG37] synthetase (radical SAM superfamily)